MTEFVKSQRGEAKLLHEGFIYSRHLTDRIKTTWRCEKYKLAKCRAKAISINADEIEVVVLVGHNHDPSPTLCEKAKWMEALKNEAQTSTDDAKKISLRALEAAPESVLAHIPFLSSIKKNVSRQKRKYKSSTTTYTPIEPKKKNTEDEDCIKVINEKLEVSE